MGEVALTAVNEATGAVGDSNTFEFTDPGVTTTTADTAYLRLIVHVNAAGQASFLKSVAIVNRAENDDGDDLVLITDPALYHEYPGIAKRIATAAFDFGDPQAVSAIQELVDSATEIAVVGALAGDDRVTIQSAIDTALGSIVESADVSNVYLNTGTGATSFITDDFFVYADIEALADAVATQLDAGTKTVNDFAYDPANSSYEPFAGDPFAANFNSVFQAAGTLRDNSFYGDTRGIEATVNIVAASVTAVASSAPGDDLATKRARALAAAEAEWHNAADVDQKYNRFLASAEYSSLPSVLTVVAVQAAIDAELAGGDEAAIRLAVRNALLTNGDVGAATTAAGLVAMASVFSEQDPRALRAIDSVIDAAVDSATAQVLADPSLNSMQASVGEAVDSAFAAVPGGRVFASAPSLQYSDYVASSDYAEAATQAAEAAAAEAAFQFNAGVDDEAALTFQVKRAVNQALIADRNEVAALTQDLVSLSGRFEEGVPMTGTLHLPALAPTNPFMHRLHPDHSEGFSIRREIALTIDSNLGADEFDLAGAGVSRVRGVYEEEIFGLHKPLGPDQDIGLKTRGVFTLNRLSLIDRLNF